MLPRQFVNLLHAILHCFSCKHFNSILGQASVTLEVDIQVPTVYCWHFLSHLFAITHITSHRLNKSFNHLQLQCQMKCQSFMLQSMIKHGVKRKKSSTHTLPLTVNLGWSQMQSNMSKVLSYNHISYMYCLRQLQLVHNIQLYLSSSLVLVAIGRLQGRKSKLQL